MIPVTKHKPATASRDAQQQMISSGLSIGHSICTTHSHATPELTSCLTPDNPCAQDDPKFQRAMMIRKPEHRLRAILQLCSGKRVCEETGSPQPAYKMEATRIVAEFPAPRGDDLEDMGPAADPIERKQVGLCLVQDL